MYTSHTHSYTHSPSYTLTEHTLIVGCTDGRVLIVDYPTGHMTTVWDADSLPVQHLVFLPHHLVFTKGCMLMVCELEEGKSLSVKGKPLTLSGVHSLPVSGELKQFKKLTVDV